MPCPTLSFPSILCFSPDAQQLAGMTFVVARSDDVFVPLVPGGAQKRVTEENVAQYCDLAIAFRCKEFDAQVPTVCTSLHTACRCCFNGPVSHAEQQLLLLLLLSLVVVVVVVLLLLLLLIVYMNACFRSVV